MQRKRGNRHPWIWLCAIVLMIGVSATTISLTSRMNSFLLDDSDAISLMPETEPQASVVQRKTNYTRAAMPYGTGSAGSSHEFEISDDLQIWSSDTEVEIFRVSYENGAHVVTVSSSDGDSVIAPGTEYSYTFKFKNNRSSRVDYRVNLEAYVTPGNIRIPIQGRWNRYDGRWIVGDQTHYAEFEQLNAAEDQAILGAGKYVYYTLDWRWPYESGDDALDTLLGNMAVDQDVTVTLKIHTLATGYSEGGSGGGTITRPVNPPTVETEEEVIEVGLIGEEIGIIAMPKTGDDSKLALWITLAGGSLILMLILFALERKEKQ